MEMKVKEAILTLNANVVIACERAGFSSETVKMIEDALDTIEDALKEQEAVAPKRIDGKRNHFTKCGNCNRDLMSGYHYCPHCGKAVKWDV